MERRQQNNHATILFCINFTRWKQNHIKAFLRMEGDIPIFISSASQAIKQGFNTKSQLITWSSKEQSEVIKLVEQFGIKPWQVEDGFIRSTGLGTDLTAPASLVVDKTGIYYDPSKPSDLETILQTKKFSETEVQRAERLRFSLLDNELSKYNLGRRFTKDDVDAAPEQKIILIPGQVEGDASILKGCVDISTNANLIKAVRKKEPKAYLIYKPHPDVVSGNRQGKVDNQTLKENCNLVLFDASITDCLDVIHEVHTMTSLVGFEGLLRHLKVVCYGRPFYSGWGLTEDIHPVARRTRKLTVDELVAGTLIDYPRYINWITGTLTTPEVIVEQLRKKLDAQGGKQSNQVLWLVRQLRKVRNFFYGIVLNRQ